MENSNLSAEEKDILKSFENNEWQPVDNLSDRRKEIQASARTTLKKNKRVNIRMSERDLSEIKRKAYQEGLPYQTLISSVLHKYINGNLVERKSA